MNANLGRILNRAVDPDQIAVIDVSKSEPDRFVSYRQLDELADAVARGIADLELPQGSVVATDIENGVEHLALLFGIQRAGHVAMPINYKLPQSTIEFILEDSSAQLAFVNADQCVSYPDELPKVQLGPDGVGGAGVVDTFVDFLNPGTFEGPDVDPGSAAELLYTSGSTGTPKGVVLSHKSHLWVLDARLQDLSMDGERVLVSAPFFHMQGLTMSQLTLAGGATLVLMPRFESTAYIAAIDEYHPTWLTGVPPMLAMMLQDKPAVDSADLSSVTTIRLGSAPVSRSLLGEIREYFPSARVINGYGTTESGPVAFGPHPDGLATPFGSVGYPHWGVELRLSTDAGTEPDSGVLEIKSPGAMTRYLGRPDLDDAFTADGFYRTGDVFRRDEHGFHYFVSRADDMISCGGENIFPSEVEKVLEGMAGINQACVVSVPDPIKGEKPVAFVVLEPGLEIDAERIQQDFFKIAPPYQHPRRVWFLDAMPVTATNKRDRRALSQEALSLVRNGNDSVATPEAYQVDSA